VFVPAYESASSLPELIPRIPPELYERITEVLIQDDGSRDRSVAVAEDLAQRYEKLSVVVNGRNLGYGGTLKKAFRYIIRAGFDAMVILHADLQYEPERLAAMLAPILREEADIVLGSRMRGDARKNGMPLYKRLGNRGLTWAMNLVLGHRFTDYHTGYVALSRAARLSFCLDRLGDGHEISAQMLIQATERSLRIVEVPTRTNYGPRSRSCSPATSLRYGLGVLVLLGAHRARRLSRRST
jgi:glycosyltransferase involved in cell wall biosynthesis